MSLKDDGKHFLRNDLYFVKVHGIKSGSGNPSLKSDLRNFDLRFYDERKDFLRNGLYFLKVDGRISVSGNPNLKSDMRNIDFSF